MHGAERWNRRVSLFGGLCSQTASPLLPLHLVSSMAKGEGYKCRVGVSRNFRACAYVRCAPARRYIYINIYIYMYIYIYRKIVPVVRLGWLAPARQILLYRSIFYSYCVYNVHVHALYMHVSIITLECYCYLLSFPLPPPPHHPLSCLLLSPVFDIQPDERLRYDKMFQV